MNWFLFPCVQILVSYFKNSKKKIYEETWWTILLLLLLLLFFKDDSEKQNTQHSKKWTHTVCCALLPISCLPKLKQTRMEGIRILVAIPWFPRYKNFNSDWWNQINFWYKSVLATLLCICLSFSTQSYKKV